MRSITLLLSALLCGVLAAQVPQAFDFQAVARDASGNVLSTQAIDIRLTVHSGTASGAVAYQETHAVATNAFGLFTVAVGQGAVVQGNFALVGWGADAHFLQVELDLADGNGFVDMGTSQLLSVPYALHAGGTDCPSVSLLGDTLRQANGCFVIIPGISIANGGCQDVDLDGFYDQTGCDTPVDCNDTVATINPAATELCGNVFDDDCNGSPDDNPDPSSWVDWHPDADGDGFGSNVIAVSACAAPPGHILNDMDCDDADPNVFPGQNCNVFCDPAELAWVHANFETYKQLLREAYSSCFGAPDQEQCQLDHLNSALVPLSADCHTCGFAWLDCMEQECLSQCVQGPEACNACGLSSGCTATFLQCLDLTDADGDGSPSVSDCDDNNPAIHPDAQEICDTFDNDCDGQVDEDNVCCPDADLDGFTTCDGDCDDANSSVSPNAAEICGNGIDDDCDGQADEGCCAPAGTACDDGNPCTVGDVEDGNCVCISGSAAPVGTACDDGDPNTINDVCDGTGNCAGTLCLDQDADGFTTCEGDCDDTEVSVFPGASEACDGVDNDCDGQTDEGCCAPAGTTCDDGLPCTVNDVEDGACNCTGTPAPDGTTCDDGNSNTINDACVAGQCTGTLCPDDDADGFTTCNGDCDDTNVNVNPAAAEVCGNGIDENCDGQVDEGCACPPAGTACDDGFPCTANDVEDGACNCAGTIVSAGTICALGSGCFSTSLCDGVNRECPISTPNPPGSPCDDGNPNTINDVCDGNGNCAGTLCTDADADAFTTCEGDCDDSNPAINPGAAEVCGNGIDDNCDGQVDEGC